MSVNFLTPCANEVLWEAEADVVLHRSVFWHFKLPLGKQAFQLAQRHSYGEMGSNVASEALFAAVAVGNLRLMQDEGILVRPCLGQIEAHEARAETAIAVAKNGELIGLIFDGNIQSLVGNFMYDESVNRAISVDVRAMREVLRKVFDANEVADELSK